LTDKKLFKEKYEEILFSIENVFKSYDLEVTRESLIEKISSLSKWHDIGKIEIPDKVLMKN
jgi:response regulator RpfG family c-di-GMP phosphodiesterase